MGRKIEQARQDEGFTLIELLVVVIIIGILAAIAIPVFLNQRERAWNADAQSNLRNAAVAQETVFTDTADYTDDKGDPGADPLTGLAAVGFRESANVTLTIIQGVDSRYCMSAVHDSGGETWYLDSRVGAPSTDECAAD